jgi:hypothetical protein
LQSRPYKQKKPLRGKKKALLFDNTTLFSKLVHVLREFNILESTTEDVVKCKEEESPLHHDAARNRGEYVRISTVPDSREW